MQPPSPTQSQLVPLGAPFPYYFQHPQFQQAQFHPGLGLYPTPGPFSYPILTNSNAPTKGKEPNRCTLCHAVKKGHICSKQMCTDALKCGSAKMHDTKKLSLQKVKFLEVQNMQEDPPVLKKSKKDLNREEAEVRHRKEKAEQEAMVAEAKRFIKAFVEFLKEYNEVDLEHWESQEGDEAAKKLGAEANRMRNLMLKKLRKETPKEMESAALVDAPKKKNIVASFTAKKEKKENDGDVESTEEDS